MFSPGSPTLNLDIRERKAERVLALLAAAGVLFGVCLSNESISFLSIATACGLLALAGVFYRAGWLWGPHRLTRIVWQADGRWLLSSANGLSVECKLSAASRVTSHILWLRWVGRPTRPVLLVSGDIAPTDFRRLVVRLFLDGRSRVDEAMDES
jgi:hypothetical protein